MSDESLLRELAEACEQLATVAELPARTLEDRNLTPAPWTFSDALPDEALLGRLVTALNAWDPEVPHQLSVNPAVELELVEFAAHAWDLIERSVRGESGAKLVLPRASRERLGKMRRMLEGWQTARAMTSDR